MWLRDWWWDSWTRCTRRSVQIAKWAGARDSECSEVVLELVKDLSHRCDWLECRHLVIQTQYFSSHEVRPQDSDTRNRIPVLSIRNQTGHLKPTARTIVRSTPDYPSSRHNRRGNAFHVDAMVCPSLTSRKDKPGAGEYDAFSKHADHTELTSLLPNPPPLRGEFSRDELKCVVGLFFFSLRSVDFGRLTLWW